MNIRWRGPYAIYPPRPTPFAPPSMLRSCVAFAGVFALQLMASGEISAQPSARARELEGRLVAPCCWTQTLDIHDSPIAAQLRAEIGQRLRSGEAETQIEDDLSVRFGPRIRAVPRGRDPRQLIPYLIAAAMLCAMISLIFAARRWLGPHQPAPAARDVDRRYESALDAELREFAERDG